jgi:hypothetical protein
MIMKKLLFIFALIISMSSFAQLPKLLVKDTLSDNNLLSNEKPVEVAEGEYIMKEYPQKDGSTIYRGYFKDGYVDYYTASNKAVDGYVRLYDWSDVDYLYMSFIFDEKGGESNIKEVFALKGVSEISETFKELKAAENTMGLNILTPQDVKLAKMKYKGASVYVYYTRNGKDNDMYIGVDW